MALNQSPLAKLLEVPDAPIELAALLIDQDFNPGVQVEAGLAKLDSLGAALSEALRASSRPASVALGDWFSSAAFVGARDDYTSPENGYLSYTLERRRGLPITLAIVLIAVGRRAGLGVQGVGFPGHFLVRVGEDFLDPFDGGRVLDASQLSAFAARAFGGNVEIQPAWLEPVDTLAIATRVLVNLKRAHKRRSDTAHMLIACDRLVDLTGAPEHFRDRGVCALQLGAFHAARADFESYLEMRASAPDRVEVVRLLEDAKRHARPLS